MKKFTIVAHRGVPDLSPENTLASFQRAVELGADAIELDVRLTADQAPVVYHYFYLEENTSFSGTIFDYTLTQLRDARVFRKNNPSAAEGYISTLAEILEMFSGKIGLEIELKGPEPEAPQIIAMELNPFKEHWPSYEITSYEPALLLAIQKLCPGLATNLLFPRSENWMGADVVEYLAIQRTRLAQASAVHLHPSQLSAGIVDALHQQGIEVHAWDVNDEQALDTIAELGIPRICTDNFPLALAFREQKINRSIE